MKDAMGGRVGTLDLLTDGQFVRRVAEIRFFFSGGDRGNFWRNRMSFERELQVVLWLRVWVVQFPRRFLLL